jgi:hypothetical protein
MNECKIKKRRKKEMRLKTIRECRRKKKRGDKHKGE